MRWLMARLIATRPSSLFSWCSDGKVRPTVLVISSSGFSKWTGLYQRHLSTLELYKRRPAMCNWGKKTLGTSPQGKQMDLRQKSGHLEVHLRKISTNLSQTAQSVSLSLLKPNPISWRYDECVSEIIDKNTTADLA